MLSGGEALIHEYAVIKIKEWADKHKLLLGIETNGTFYERLKELIDKNMLDFVAMDIKSRFDKDDYKRITGVSRIYGNFLKSFKLLKNSGLPHEFRMTVTPTLHSLEDIKEINKKVAPSKLVLQRFQPGKNVVDKSLNDESFSEEFIKELKKWVKKQKNVEMRFWE